MYIILCFLLFKQLNLIKNQYKNQKMEARKAHSGFVPPDDKTRSRALGNLLTDCLAT